MSKRDDYLDNAAQTLNLASHVSKLARRFHLLALGRKNGSSLPIGAIANARTPLSRLRSIRWLNAPSARFQPTTTRSLSALFRYRRYPSHNVGKCGARTVVHRMLSVRDPTHTDHRRLRWRCHPQRSTLRHI